MPDVSFRSSSSTFSGVITIQSTFLRLSTSVVGKINVGRSIGVGVYSILCGVVEHALRDIVRVSEARTLAVDL